MRKLKSKGRDANSRGIRRYFYRGIRNHKRSRLILVGAPIVTPQVSISRYVGRFTLISDAQWKLLFLARVCLWLSRLIVHISQNSELFSLTKGRILEPVKNFYFSEQMQIRKSISSHNSCPYSWQWWYYPIYVRIRCLDSRSTSKYLIQIRILPQNLFVSTSN